MSAALRVLHDELPNIDVTVSSQYSPDLADALRRGMLDLAFMRREKDGGDLEYRLLISEPLMAVMPSDHRLAALDIVSIEEIARESFIHMSKTAPVLRELIDDYLKRSHVSIAPSHEVDNIAMAMSLIASTRSVALLPAYAQNFLPWSVTSRPLKGDVPTIDLVAGYSKANASATLKLLLSRLDDVIAGVGRPRRE
jgi:LysR family hca operon transcriptional activator